MTRLKLLFLGSPHIELNGTTITLQRRRSTALLAYLAVTGRPQPRETLAALFWPESDHQHAHKALRRDLSELNLALGGQWIESDRQSVTLRSAHWSDVAHFRQLLADPSPSLLALTNAVELVRADFLSGFSLVDAPQFDDWQFYQNEQLRLALSSALAQLVELVSAQGNDEGAIDYARRWLTLDPFHEAAHRCLMRLYAHTGQQSAAIRQYDSCRKFLADELGIPPSEETTSLYQQIVTRTLSSTESPLAESKVQRRPLAPPPHHNLPTQTTAFIGREQDIDDIKHLLIGESQCRMLTLLGPGGIGKTRLALTVASHLATSFTQGVCYISLAPVAEADYTVAAIAEALHINFSGNIEPKEQLLVYLSKRKMLLLLDNFEHLLDSAGLLSEILNRAPGVILLITTRERLNLREEWIYEVRGLAFPPERNPNAQPLLTYSALQLFIQRARQVDSTFVPSPNDVNAIAHICQLVDGMPLGLELAAPWIRSLSSDDIAVEIERNIDFLTTTLRNMPERHRSLRVVFEQTWQRLSPPEQDILSKLSLFRGGCTRHAAEQVTGASLDLLSSLVDKALLRRANTGRYELHELVRQFAAAKLQDDPAATRQAQTRHGDYFVSLIAAKTDGIKGRVQKETLLELKADIDNIRLAWRRVVDEADSHAISRCAECLFIYYLYGNGYDEGQSEFGRAVLALQETTSLHTGNPEQHAPATQQAHLLCYLMAAQGYFLAHRFDLAAGQRLLEQALERLSQTEYTDQRVEAFAQLWLGWAHYFQGRNSEGKAYVRQSLAFFEKSGDRWAEGWSLLGSGNFIRDGRPAEAAAILQRGVTLCQESGDLGVLSYCALNLGATLRELGHFAQAQQYIDQSVNLSLELDNILGLGYSYYRKGQLQIDQGHFQQAIRTLQQSVAYFQEVGNVHANMAALSLGRAYQRNGNDELAEQFYHQAFTLFQATDNRPWLARSYTELGSLARDRGHFDQAEHNFMQAMAIWQTIAEQEAGMAATLAQIGQLLSAMATPRHQQAQYYLQQSLILAQKHQLAPLALEICLTLSILLGRDGASQQVSDLLTLPVHHQAATFETRQKARRHLSELAKQGRISPHQLQLHPLNLWIILQNFMSSPIPSIINTNLNNSPV